MRLPSSVRELVGTLRELADRFPWSPGADPGAFAVRPQTSQGPNRSYRRFVVLGHARSGSSLLIGSLRRHPQVVAFGELFVAGRIGFNVEGYDNHSGGETIPSLARIFAVADVFDALSSKRPYKDPIPYERVVAILLEGRGTHFDPEILDRFLEIAPPLYQTYAKREDDLAARDLDLIMRRYYQADLGEFL